MMNMPVASAIIAVDVTCLGRQTPLSFAISLHTCGTNPTSTDF